MWLLPLTSGFACGFFAGGITTKGRVGPIVIAATGGFAVWFLTYRLLKPPAESHVKPTASELLHQIGTLPAQEGRDLKTMLGAGDDINRGDLPQAERKYHKVANEAGSEGLRAEASNGEGVVAVLRGDSSNADRCLIKAGNLTESSSGLTDDERLFLTMKNLANKGVWQAFNRDYDSAMKSFEAAANKGETGGGDRDTGFLAAMVRMNAAQAALDHGDRSQAGSNAQKAIDDLKSLPSEEHTKDYPVVYLNAKRILDQSSASQQSMIGPKSSTRLVYVVGAGTAIPTPCDGDSTSRSMLSSPGETLVGQVAVTSWLAESRPNVSFYMMALHLFGNCMRPLLTDFVAQNTNYVAEIEDAAVFSKWQDFESSVSLSSWDTASPNDSYDYLVGELLRPLESALTNCLSRDLAGLGDCPSRLREAVSAAVLLEHTAILEGDYNCALNTLDTLRVLLPGDLSVLVEIAAVNMEKAQLDWGAVRMECYLKAIEVLKDVLRYSDDTNAVQALGECYTACSRGYWFEGEEPTAIRYSTLAIDWWQTLWLKNGDANAGLKSFYEILWRARVVGAPDGIRDLEELLRTGPVIFAAAGRTNEWSYELGQLENELAKLRGTTSTGQRTDHTL